MSVTEYQKATNEAHEVELESSINVAYWDRKLAAVGDTVGIVVETNFVASGSKIEVKVETLKGKKVDTLTGTVFGGIYRGELTLSDKAVGEIKFTAKLPDHGVEGGSNLLTVRPVINIKNMKWSQKTAQQGDELTLSADADGLQDGQKVEIRIYEFDQGGMHDLVCKLPAVVENNKLEKIWMFQYFADIDDIPIEDEIQNYGKHYQNPEYFFVVEVSNRKYGDQDESGLLEFKDYVALFLVDQDNNPIQDAKCEITAADGNTVNKTTDAKGYIKIDEIAPGRFFLKVPEYEQCLIKNLVDGNVLDKLCSGKTHHLGIMFSDYMFSL
ncbi:MAG: carboxypeptidase-like regulatory domain-containing protein [Gammaproteobacteria bacterium]|nr:carboxypeptidase-like regulatory domain-containing protein [Gammaproteobacteria bacterium]